MGTQLSQLPHGKGHSSDEQPPLFGHVYCDQTVIHLSNC